MVLGRHGHAHVAAHTVEEVDAQAGPYPADVAEWTVVDRLARIILKELTYVTIVASKRCAFTLVAVAGGPYRLYCAASHTNHLPRRISVHGVI
mmetsp:Transcript_36701/g.59296  ORF Transcript_36701/g.59296 Transcript_36701/m.59296 type:complete len:93 (+) Transcript_36701:511-789(+)